MEIFDYIKAKAQALFWNEYQANQSEAPFLGDELFPAEKQAGLDMSYIKGASGVAAVLSLSAFDAKALGRNRIGFGEMSAEMPFFKNDMKLNEKLRQKLITASTNSNSAYFDEVLRRIFEDNMQLLKGAAATRERMRMQLITTGLISIVSNGQEYKYDYGMDETQKTEAAVEWSNPSADIVADIIAAQDAIEAKTGVRPTRAICRRKVLRDLMKNNTIKKSIYILGNGDVSISEASTRRFIEEQTGVTIAVYEKIYKDEDGNVQYYIPEDLFVLLPTEQIGKTLFGTTPEEADLVVSKVADVAIVDTGVAISTYGETDPVTRTTKVSEICMPTAENLDKVAIIDVAGTPTK